MDAAVIAIASFDVCRDVKAKPELKGIAHDSKQIFNVLDSARAMREVKGKRLIRSVFHRLQRQCHDGSRQVLRGRTMPGYAPVLKGRSRQTSFAPAWGPSLQELSGEC